MFVVWCHIKKAGEGGERYELFIFCNKIVLSLWPRFPQLICKAMAPAKGAFTHSREPRTEAPLDHDRCELLG